MTPERRRIFVIFVNTWPNGLGLSCLWCTSFCTERYEHSFSLHAMAPKLNAFLIIMLLSQVHGPQSCLTQRVWFRFLGTGESRNQRVRLCDYYEGQISLKSNICFHTQEEQYRNMRVISKYPESSFPRIPKRKSCGWFSVGHVVFFTYLKNNFSSI